MPNVLSPPPDPANLPAFRKWLRELYELLGRSTGTATLSVSGTASTITGSVSSGQVSGAAVTKTVTNYLLDEAPAGLGLTSETDVAWPTAFADANYSVSITPTTVSGSPLVEVSNKFAGYVVLRTTNQTGAAAQARVDVTGVHA